MTPRSTPFRPGDRRRRSATRLRKNKISTNWGDDETAYIKAEAERLGYDNIAVFIRDKVLNLIDDDDEPPPAT